MSTTIKPVLKWVGGKTQILDDVLAQFPREINNYYEPFLGGASVLFGLLSRIRDGAIRVSGRIYASDVNPYIIGLYKNIQQYPDILIVEVKKLVADFARCTGTEVNRSAASLAEAMSSPESCYYWIRAQFNALTKEGKCSPVGSAMLLFLNKTCFRGVYREGPRGFNVPYGNYKNPTILDEEHIHGVSALIRDVKFCEASFTESLRTVAAGDFVYLDPPYAPETETSFVSYTSDGFDIEKHRQLFAMCNEMHTRGVKLLMSNANVPLVRGAFPAPMYHTKIIVCRRAINSKKPDATTKEVLIAN